MNSLPATSHTVSLFLADLHSSGYATSTIRTFLSGIAYQHKIRGFSDPTATFLIEKAIHGLRKLKPTQDTRKPITIPILTTLIQTLSNLRLERYDQVLYRAMFSTAFFALCRIGEITKSDSNHNLVMDNILYNRNLSAYSIRFDSFKHSCEQ